MVQFEYDPRTLNLSDQHLMRLGEMAAAAAQIEYLAATTYWAILDRDERVGMSVTAGATFDRVCRLLRDIADQKLSSARQSRQDLIRALDLSSTAMKERNRLLHGHWTKRVSSEPGANPTLITRTRKGHIETRLDVTTQDLQSVTGQLVAAATYFRLAYFAALLELDRLEQGPDGTWHLRSFVQGPGPVGEGRRFTGGSDKD